MNLAAAHPSSNSLGILSTSQAIHYCSVKIGLDLHTMVSSSLVNVYSKFEFLKNVQYHLIECPREILCYGWNIMIKGYAQMGLVKDAFFIFSEFAP